MRRISEEVKHEVYTTTTKMKKKKNISLTNQPMIYYTCTARHHYHHLHITLCLHKMCVFLVVSCHLNIKNCIFFHILYFFCVAIQQSAEVVGVIERKLEGRSLSLNEFFPVLYTIWSFVYRQPSQNSHIYESTYFAVEKDCFNFMLRLVMF